MSLQDWNPHEAGAALQKWKKKLRKAFGLIVINEGKQPVSRMATLEKDPSKVPLPPTPKRLECTPPTKRGADRDAFGTADASPYLQDSHMVTPRSTSRMRRMDAEDEGSRGCRGGARASRNGLGRRQTNTDASSSDDDDLLPPTYENEDPQAESTRQMREIAALNDSDPTPRIEMASHRPLDCIKPFSGSRNKTDKWCIPFELSLRDGAIHWFRQLPKKTKRTWKLLSNAFIRYYCSQFTQTALSRYYSAKRERSEHLCDYLNRLNGYARNARLQFEKGGHDAKEYVQQFLVTRGDDNMAESLYHTRVNDIHELEEIIEDVLKGKERMAKRDGVTRHSRNRDSRRDEPHNRQSRRDRCESDRCRDDYRNTPRVTLADASLDDILAELEGREATRSVPSVRMADITRTKMIKTSTTTISLTMLAAMVHWSIMTATSRRLTRVNVAQLLKARTPVQTTVRHEETSQIASEASIKTVAVAGEPSSRTVEVASAASIKTVEVVTEASVKTLVVAVTSTVTTGAHSTDRVQSACELFRNFQDLAKFVRIKGTKEELPPELKSVVQFAEPSMDAECIYAFMGNGKWPDDYITSVKATETEKERSQVLGGGVEDVMECADVDGSISEDSFGRVSSATSHEPQGRSKMMWLNPGEKQGWWSAKKFDRRIRMRALV
ncbi:hypothetical protein PC118_g23346 [Phytophthora cactorum]|uniref:Retrotransposon gag domain-containing protein n=1 Tax=Phytophthora cactorum TaxID=29920 RepID=A0A8T1EVB5_9STRA|nr:hypothetical protein PC112_g23726 [Phytophthora cactorum]KAG2872986.1 hypothetical protein PC114_g26082 [Phytophthora cactorum]KAG2958789.1 hypothetical protein PC118_g23346 [Phytophthora cactorum]KAG2969437.1 hypothetical protein PC119_g23915 [Phytophthora cactorum]